MDIKSLKISMIVSISFDTEAMSRLNPQQRTKQYVHCKLGNLLEWLPMISTVMTGQLNVSGYVTTPQTARMTDHAAVDPLPEQVNGLSTFPESVHQSYWNCTTDVTVGTHQRPICADTL